MRTPVTKEEKEEVLKCKEVGCLSSLFFEFIVKVVAPNTRLVERGMIPLTNPALLHFRASSA